jgi:hypothetical protein
MRTSEQISKIKATITDPFSIENFLSTYEILYLVDLFDKSQEKTYKNTGPITVDLKPYFNHHVIEKIIAKLKDHILDFEITAAFFFKTDLPHIIHNDDTFELPEGVYKGITLPLHLENFNGEYPKLCFFDQFYFHGPAKFFKGSNDIPTYYNKQVYEYSDVTGLVDVNLIDEHNYFKHLKPQWLEGLSLNSVLDWIPGNALIFDSVRLHCASDFTNLGIKSKLGISIFTKK